MLLKVRDVDEVLAIIEDNFSVISDKIEKVPLSEATGRVLAADIVSEHDIPSFNKSVVDGYAVRSSDTFGASDALPALLEYKGEVVIGAQPDIIPNPGQCMYVPTGGMMPDGCDAVVMIEDTEDLGGQTIAVYRPVSPWQNTIKAGEDIVQGQVVVRNGMLIRPHHVGVISSIGLTEIPVIARPRVFILSTGDELIEPGKRLLPGQVWDINSYSLAAAVAEDGGVPIIGGIVDDDREAIKERVGRAIIDSDAVLISGGSSAGVRDYTAGIINELGEPGVMVHGISVKPGKPTILGKVCGKPVIGMPGQPVSSIVIYMTIVSPLIRRLAGLPPAQRATVTAVCGQNYASSPGREEYLMVDVSRNDNGYIINPVYGKSGMITTISSATGMVRIPKNTEGLYRGQQVEVIML
jgi:molybdopterin molybdotransferase